MEKKVSSVKILNIIICVILLIAFAIIGTNMKVNAEENRADEVLPSISQIGYSYRKLPLNIYIPSVIKTSVITYDMDYYIDENIDTIKFFAKMFNYHLDDVIYNLKSKEKVNSGVKSKNIGYLKDKDGNLKEFDNFEYGLIEYFYDLNKNRKDLRHIKYEPYTGSADYVEKLIIYYSNIYNNVDRTTLLSIGAAESRYYKVKYMLKYNNVYGGMSSRGLIKHNNIELGVLSYVRMMSKSYYGKGLTNEYSIGRVYCPVFENGVKKASSHWIGLVQTAKKKYRNYTDDISLTDLINNTQIA